MPKKISLEGQLDMVYNNMNSVLENAGVKWSDVVRSVEMVSPRFSFDHEALDRTRKSIHGNILPSVTTVTANQILPAGSDFAMELWAVLD
jgi:enamine deaminase RidA (YjgF/YER057c/UK114 family)